VNSKKPGLNTRYVRQALSVATDRQSLLKEIYRGQGIVPHSAIPKGSFAYDAGLAPYAYDPSKAKALLKEAGAAGPITVDLMVPKGAETQAVAELIQNMAAEVVFSA